MSEWIMLVMMLAVFAGGVVTGLLTVMTYPDYFIAPSSSDNQ